MNRRAKKKNDASPSKSPRDAAGNPDPYGQPPRDKRAQQIAESVPSSKFQFLMQLIMIYFIVIFSRDVDLMAFETKIRGVIRDLVEPVVEK